MSLAYKQRSAQLKETPSTERYPNFTPSHTIEQFIAQFGALAAGAETDEATVSVAGRIRGLRTYGNLVFLDIQNGWSPKLQLMLNKRLLQLTTSFKQLKRQLHLGAIVGAKGQAVRTEAGELTLRALTVQVLAPCLHELPEDLSDPKLRVDQRYLDLLVNPASFERMRRRCQIVTQIRSFLEQQGFLEVETAILCSQASGAAARPFTTYHHALKRDLHLRISPELALKRLVVGGMHQVFELGRQFRNEQIDPSHNPEFTSCEAYIAYRDYHYWLHLTEQLFHQLDPDQFKLPFQRIDINSFLTSEIQQRLNMPFRLPGESFQSPAMHQHLRLLVHSLGFTCHPPQTSSRLLNVLIEELIEPHCQQPTFVMNHPTIISPLAKSQLEDPELTERFELFVAGRELCNAVTELNDPVEQLTRFQDQAKEREQGDQEATLPDLDYIQALEHGLPPTAGWGLGVDRLVMLLTGVNTIKDVILFPARGRKNQLALNTH